MEFALPPTDKDDTLRFLSDWWFQIAAKIFDKVVEVCELNEEQIIALRSVALKPMAFTVQEIAPVEDEDGADNF
jgi:hypothetical protein